MQFVYFVLTICSLLFVTRFTASSSSTSTSSPLARPRVSVAGVDDGDKCKMNDENRSSSVHSFDPSVKSDQREIFSPRSQFASGGGVENKQINEKEKTKKHSLKEAVREKEEQDLLPLILPHYHPHLTLKRSTRVPEQQVQDGRVLEQSGVFHKAQPGEMFTSTFVSPKTMADTWRDLRRRRRSLSPFPENRNKQHEITARKTTTTATTATAKATTAAVAPGETTTQPEVTGSTAFTSSPLEGSFLSSPSNRADNKLQSSNDTNTGTSKTKRSADSEGLSVQIPNESPLLSGVERANISCRIELGIKLPLFLYALHTCGKCYFYLPDYAFKQGRKLSLIGWGKFDDPEEKRVVYSNQTAILSKTFASASMFAKWQQCCVDAVECCLKHLRHHGSSSSSSSSSAASSSSSSSPSSASSTATFAFAGESHPLYLTVNQEEKNKFIPASGDLKFSGKRGEEERVTSSSSLTSDRSKVVSHFANDHLGDINTVPWKVITSKSLTSAASAEAFFDSFFHSSRANSRNKRSQDEPLVCPRTWDGWTCWKDDVPVGVTVQNTCPEHIYWQINVPPCRGYVTKTCTSSGWYVNNNSSEWSNYTNCARDDIHIRRLRYSIITNLISVSFILPALVIFNCYRQLSNSPRIRLHKHLFASLFIYAILSSLLKLNLLMKRSDDVYISKETSQNTSSLDLYCLILSLSLRYFRSTTYLCMFNEAYYLYQLIKKVFDAPPVTPLILIAYVIPLIMTSTYVAARSLLPIFASNDLTAATTSMSTTMQLPSIKVEHLVEITTRGPDEFTSSSTSDVVYESIVNSTSQWTNVTGEITTANDVEVEDDPCWMLPARDSWKEWIINGPNLAMLLINSLLILPIVKEIYMKATSMPLPSKYSSRPVKRTDSQSIEPSGNNNRRSKSQLNRLGPGPPGSATTGSGGTKVKSHNEHPTTGGSGNCNSPNGSDETGDVSLLSTMKNDSQSTTTASGLRSSTHMNSHSTTAMTAASGAGGHSVSKASLLVSLRAATLLLPLYGLHYLVIVYRPDIDICWLSELYHYLSLTLDGLQGFLVSILFCFGNNEVRQLLKRTLGKKSDANIYLTEIVPVPRASP